MSPSETTTTTPFHLEDDDDDKVNKENDNKIQSRLPQWLNHLAARTDLRVFLRCWAAVWTATLLMLITPSMRNLGLSTFFAALVLFIVPPAGILTVYLLATLTLLLGMCLAWAWGLLAMKAAFAVRSDAEMQGLARALAREAAAVAGRTPGGDPAAVVAARLLFDGFYLDGRVVAVYYVMGCAFIYALARVRYANPKLVILQLLGTVTMDVFLLTGPVLPSFNARLPETLVKPAAAGVALGVACSVLVFPRSTSYVLLAQAERLVRMLDKPLESTRGLFAAGTEAARSRETDELRAAKAGVVEGFKAMQPSLAFLPLDVSRGRWNADDVRGLHARVRDLVAASLFLLEFHLVRVSLSAADKAERLGARLAGKLADGTPSPRAAKAIGGQQEEEQGDVQDCRDEKQADTARGFPSGVLDAMESPEKHGSLRAGLLDALRAATADVLHVNSRAITLAAEAVHLVNTSRWYESASAKTRLDRLHAELFEMHARLQAAREACVTDTNDAIIEAHADLFDEQGRFAHHGGDGNGNVRAIVLDGFMVGMVLEERIVNMAVATERLLHYTGQLLEARPRRRIWLPNRLGYAVSWLTRSDMPAPVPGRAADSAADDPDEWRSQTEETHRRLRMVSRGNRGIRPPKKKDVLTRAVVGTYRWLSNPGGIYALRMVVVTVAVAIPASLRPTAGFVYREKGMWAVIMAQACLLMYMADFTFSLVSRGAGTLIGGTLGLVAWYAGSGSGPGNPYGMAATTAVACAVLMWWRLYLPAALTQASIMTAATFALVVGFSWDAHHHARKQQAYGLPGVGYEVFWKRLVLVLIGFGAALVVQIFPRPPSATRHVCKSLANNVRALNNHYALLISQWGRSAQNTGAAAAAAAASEQITIQVAEELTSLSGAIALLKIEISTTPFDQAILATTRDKCQAMNQSLGKLLVLSANLPEELQRRLARTMGLLEDRSVSNVMCVLSIVEAALRTGAPLPERMPVPLVESCFGEWHGGRRGRVDVELTVELVRRREYRQYCVAVSAYLSFLATVDDLVGELKGRLGETHVVQEWAEVGTE